MRIAVCDDLREERARMLPLLREFFAKNGLAAEFSEYDSGEALLAAFTPGAFALVFLDIYMSGMTGMETARLLKAEDPDCVLIFTTTSLSHGADAFDVEAFHYLVKPVERSKLFSALNKWYEGLCEIRTVPLRCNRLTREIRIRDILYVDVIGRNSTVHTRTETLQTSMSLATLSALLPESEFCRPIRYCLVALMHIASVGQDSLTLDNGIKIPVSRREYGALRERLAAYRLRRLRGR